mgnify:FL=1
MATLHIKAEYGDFGKVVLTPGDPQRATMIAENFLHDVKKINDIRGMVAYTGLTSSGKRISVMSTGMGQPSMGIYSYELFKYFGVEMIIRVGTCGSYQENVNIGDIVIATVSSTDSNWAQQYHLKGNLSMGCDFIAGNVAYSTAKRLDAKVHAGNVLSADIFYDESTIAWKEWAKLNVLAVEMESYALYCNAARLGKKALAILTVTDSFPENKHLEAEDRITKCMLMAQIAVETAEKFA